MTALYVRYCFLFAGSTVFAAMMNNISQDTRKDYQVIKLKDQRGNLSRTIILPKMKILNHIVVNASAIDPQTSTNFTNELPEEDSSFILVSSSSSLVNRTTNTKSQVGASSVKNNVLFSGNKRIRRRRRKKRPVATNKGLIEAESNPFGLKKSKFLNLFTIVSFPNDDCVDGGTCFTETECSHMDGTVGEACAKGYGVCCMLTSNCGTTGEINGRVFRALGESGVCSLTINKIACAKQIRLDFINLELEAPAEGECGPERLIITGQNPNSPVPILCGSNSGQHESTDSKTNTLYNYQLRYEYISRFVSMDDYRVYVDVDESPGPVLVSVVSSESQNFAIKVNQICDGNTLQAPKHCLQYYLGEEGVIESFNYRTDNEQSSGYLNNLDYSICVKKGSGMCTIMYTNEAEGIEYPFDINNLDANGEATVSDGEAGAEVFNCPDDFIVVRGVRLCGQKINDASTQPDFTRNSPIFDSTYGPFMVSVVSDRTISGRGFRLRYKQFSC